MPITVRCDNGCGVQSINAEDLALILFVPDVTRNYYIFGCPRCRLETRCKATTEDVILLAGVVPTGIIHLDETSDAPPQGAPALTNDDVLDFMLELDAWGSTPRG